MTREEALAALREFLRLAHREFHGAGNPDGTAYQRALRAVEVLSREEKR